MLLNMFTIFDPSTKNLPMNYLLMILILKIYFKFWKLNNLIKSMFIMNKSYNLLFNSLIMFVMLINLMNLLPMFFSPSNNIMMTLNLTLLMWISMLNFSLINNYNILFMNFSPKLTMLKLIFLINLIEMNSLLFMIMSLSMRLMINMMMSHITIYMINSKKIIYIYFIIELMIIMMQSYVFFILNLINFKNIN